MKWNNKIIIESQVKVRIQTQTCVELHVNNLKYRVPTFYYSETYTYTITGATGRVRQSWPIRLWENNNTFWES